MLRHRSVNMVDILLTTDDTAQVAEDLYLHLGRILRRERRAREITQEQLAHSVGLTRTSITNIERGRQAIAVHVLVQLAGALGFSSVDVLVEALRDAEVAGSRANQIPRVVKRGVESEPLRDWVVDLIADDAPQGSPRRRTRGRPSHEPSRANAGRTSPDKADTTPRDDGSDR